MSELLIVLEHQVLDVLAIEDTVRTIGLRIIDGVDKFLVSVSNVHVAGVLQGKADNLGLTGREHRRYFSSGLASWFVHVEADYHLLVRGEPLICLLDIVPCTLCATDQGHYRVAITKRLTDSETVDLTLSDDHLLATIAEEVLPKE